MINEKVSKYISLISISLAVIFVFISVFTVNSIKYTKAVSTYEEGESINIDNILDKNVITDINIKIKDSDWQWLLENATEEEYRSADVTINGESFYNVGIRPKGNSSLSSVANDDTTDRYSFKIDFGKYVDGQTYHGIRKLALNNNISDSTYMKEAISYDIYNFLGVPTPEYSYSNIKINGNQWGLYLALEIIDERFIEKNYGELGGNLYKPETMGVGAKQEDNKGQNVMPNIEGNKGKENQIMNPPNISNDLGVNNTNDKNNEKPNIENNQKQEKSKIGQMPFMMGEKNSEGADLKYIDDNFSSYSILRKSAVLKSTTDKDFEKVIEMMKSLESGVNIEENLNVEEVLKYFAVNTFLVNLDSYSGGMYHNYYLYEKDGICEILPWDLNMSFGGFSVNSGSRAINFPIDSPVTGDLENFPLIEKLLENDEYKAKYHGYLNKIIEEYFESGIFNKTVTKNDKLIENYVKIDSTAFYNYEEYKKAIEQLLIFGEDRTKSVKAQLNGEQSSTEYGNIETSLNLQALGEQNLGGKRQDEKINDNNLGNNNIPQNVGMPSNREDTNNISQKNGDMNKMPVLEEIQKANNILNNRKYSELSDEEKDKLNELGISEENINMLNSMRKQDRKEIANTSFIKMYYIIMGIILVILIISIIFVMKYKRKRN